MELVFATKNTLADLARFARAQGRARARARSRGRDQPRLLGARARRRAGAVPAPRPAVLRDPLERSGGDRADQHRAQPGRAQAARRVRDARHRAQSRHDDRARAPIPTWSASEDARGDRSGPGDRLAHRRGARGRAQGASAGCCARTRTWTIRPRRRRSRRRPARSADRPARARARRARTRASRPTACSRTATALMLSGLSLRAIHTPGHASNHLCYLLENTRMLFTGDHVMQGSTVVINPPDGDMRAYLASLELLLGEDIADPRAGPRLSHRRAAPRSAAPDPRTAWRARRRWLARSARLGAPTLEELVPEVYDDVSPRLHARGACARSPRTWTSSSPRARARGGRPLHAGTIFDVGLTARGARDEQHDKTLKLVTNLDRAGDRGAARARSAARPQSADLDRARADVHRHRGHAARADRAAASAAPSSGSPTSREHKGLAAQLELVEMNLPNLK